MHTLKYIIGSITAIICILSFIFAVSQGMNWKPGSNIFDKVRRAILLGVGFLLTFVSGAIAFDFLGSKNSSINWSIKSWGSLLCFALPVSILVMFVSFLGFLQREATLQVLTNRLDKVTQKSTKEKEE